MDKPDIDGIFIGAVKAVPVGKYRHWKGAIYEVVSHSLYCSEDKLFPTVIYVDSNGRIWSRSVEDFTAVKDGVKRFEKIS